MLPILHERLRIEPAAALAAAAIVLSAILKTPRHCARARRQDNMPIPSLGSLP